MCDSGHSQTGSDRAQTEPLAALVAVSVMILGLGIYGVYFQSVLPGVSDGTTADRTIDRIWDDIEDDGLLYAHDTSQVFVASQSLPTGKTVYVQVSAFDADHEAERVVAWGAFPKGYPTDTSRFDIAELHLEFESDGPPPEASVASRSIPVTVDSRADVRAGTLEVYVW